VFPTVAWAALREGRSDDSEITGLANAVRKAVNMVSRVRVTITTVATGVFTTAWISDDMPEGTAWAVDYHVVWRTSAGTAGRGRYDQAALFYRQAGGSATQQGGTVTITPSIESIIAANTQFLVVGNAIAVQVVDDAASTFNWDVFVEVREVT
jgi:hypothetical protein